MSCHKANLGPSDDSVTEGGSVGRESNYWVPAGSNEMEIYSKIIGLLEKATQQDGKFALAYCLTAKVHDILYDDYTDRTPERRALGDTAVNKALRLRPDLPKVHLALAFHLYYCYRDFERARVQTAIAGQTLSNNSDLLELTGLIDRVQGRWEKSTADLERAITLDPLADNYLSLRQWRDQNRILDQLIELRPDDLGWRPQKAESAFREKADVKGARAAYEALPSSTKDEPHIT
jgi:tetratricopeptide (TPR) repeat protein